MTINLVLTSKLQYRNPLFITKVTFQKQRAMSEIR